MKQAQSASRAAETLMASGSPTDDSDQVKELKEKLANAEKDAESAKKNVDAMKTQSESLASEYDRLLEEKDKLERKVSIMDGGDKKDD